MIYNCKKAFSWHIHGVFVILQVATKINYCVLAVEGITKPLWKRLGYMPSSVTSVYQVLLP